MHNTRSWIAFEAKYESDDELVHELKKLGYSNVHAPRITVYKKLGARLRKKYGTARIKAVVMACPGYVLAQVPSGMFVTVAGMKNATGIVEVGGTCYIEDGEVELFLDMCQKTALVFAKERGIKAKKDIKKKLNITARSFVGKLVEFYLGEVLIQGKAVGANDSEVSVEAGLMKFSVDPEKLKAAS